LNTFSSIQFLIQLSSSDADGLQNVNMTNLAIKGILGIRAFAEIANVIGQRSDYSSYKACPLTSSIDHYVHLLCRILLHPWPTAGLNLPVQAITLHRLTTREIHGL
jgi:hypothetical protein